jgi:hypothetical protein
MVLLDSLVRRGRQLRLDDSRHLAYFERLFGRGRGKQAQRQDRLPLGIERAKLLLRSFLGRFEATLLS